MRLTALYHLGARLYWALVGALVVGIALGVGGGATLLQLGRSSHDRHERVLRAEAALTEQILSAERNCQRYLLTGDSAALEAYRRANDGIDRCRDTVGKLARDLAPWEPGLGPAAALVKDRLGDWRRQYVLQAIEFRLSQRWQELEQFNRQDTNGLWYGRVEAALAGLHDRLRQAALSQDDQTRVSWLAAASALGGGIALVLCGLLVFVPVGVRALRRLRAHSRLAESLMTYAEEVHGATSEAEISMAIGRAVVLDGGQSHCNIVMRRGDGAEVVHAEGEQPAARRTSPILRRPELCPVLRSGERHVVEHVRRSTTCDCPLGVPERGGYACIPLLTQDGVPGLANVQSFTGRLFDDDHLVEHLSALGRIGSLALSGLRSLTVARREATTDGLTGVYNRRHFEESLLPSFDRAVRDHTTVALIMLDLDHFKRFNDTHGHQAGDHLLQAFATMASRYVRQHDILARYGGEEFVMMLPGVGREKAGEIAGRIREGTRTLTLSNLPNLAAPVTTVSIGVSAYPDDGASAKATLRAADDALYRAKQEGRDRVVLAGDWNPVTSG